MGRLARAFSVGLTALCAALPAGAARADLDLLGTWFVLIHYRDSQTANPDADRWLDRVWKLEKKGSRLQWTEYPIVVFSDASGRFGAVAGNPRARLLRSWEPNEAQLREIAEGPRVNSRGSKTKSLRGSTQRGYESVGRATVASAMTVGYQETWSIDDPTGLPVFTFEDALGTSAALAAGDGSAASGRTRYTALEVSPDGSVISGSYVRDESRAGTFRLIRAGAVRDLESDGRTPNEKLGDRVQQQIREAVAGDYAYDRMLESLEQEGYPDVRTRIGDQKLRELWSRYQGPVVAGDEEARRELREAIRSAYRQAVEDQSGREE